MLKRKENVAWNERIAACALDALKNPAKYGVRLEPTYCLNFTRIVIERALGFAPRGFYKFVQGEDSNPTARELEVLFRKQFPRWIIPFARARVGDMVFWKDLPPEFGHVGIIVKRGEALWVAQNTTQTTGGVHYKGALRVIELGKMPKPSSIIRIRP